MSRSKACLSCTSYGYVLLCFLALFLSSVGTSALAQPSSRAAEGLVRDWISRLDAGGIAVSTSAVEMDGARGLIRLRDFQVSLPKSLMFGSVTAKASEVEISAPSVESSGYSLKSAQFLRMIITSELGVAELESLQLDAPSFKAAMPASTDAGRPLQSLAMALRQVIGFEFSAARIAGLQWKPAETKGEPNRIARIVASDFKAGQIEQIVFGDITLRAGDPEKANDQQTTRVDSATVQGIALHQAINALDSRVSARSGPNDQWIDLVKSVTVAGYQRQAPGEQRSFTQATFSKLSIRSLDAATLALFDRASSEPDFVRNNPEEARKVGEALSAFVQLGTADVDGLSFTDGKAAPTRRSGLGRLQVSGLEPKRAASVLATDIAIQDGDNGLRMAKLAFADVDLIGLPSALPTDGRPAAIPVFKSLDLEDLVFVNLGTKVDLKALRFRAKKHIGAIPTEFSGVIDTLEVPVQSIVEPSLRVPLTELGLQTLTINAEIGGTWVEPRELFELDQIKLTIADLGTIRLSGSFAKVSRTIFERGIFDESGATSLMVRQLRMNFTDMGLVARFFSGAAAANKTSPDQLRRALTTNMPAVFGAIPDASIRNRLVFASVAFLNDPKSLEVSTLLQSDVPFSAILAAWQNKRETVPNLLKLDAVANRRP